MAMTYYAFCKNDMCRIEGPDPYVTLLFDILGDSPWPDEPYIETTSWFYDNREPLFRSMMQNLLENDRKVLTGVYGLFGQKARELEETVTELGLGSENCQTVLDSSLQQLRKTSALAQFHGEIPSPNYTSGYMCGRPYQKSLETLLKEEAKSVLRGYDYKAVYLPRILQKSRISITSKCGTPVEQIMLEKSGLTVRAYNCLIRAGYRTLGEITELSEDELMEIRNLGRKCTEEIKQEINDRVRDGLYIKEPYQTIEIVRNGVKTVYRYFDATIDQIVESIYNDVCNEESTVLNSPVFSPGLCELLLLKGYFFEDEFLDEAEQLVQELTDFGFPDYANEISSYIKFRQEKETEYDKILLYRLPEALTEEETRKIEQCNPSLEAIRSCVSEIKEERLDRG